MEFGCHKMQLPQVIGDIKNKGAQFLFQRISIPIKINLRVLKRFNRNSEIKEKQTKTMAK